MRRSLAAALLRSACGSTSSSSSSGLRSSSSGGGAASVVRRSISSIGGGGARSLAATTTPFSARGGAASCSSSPQTSSAWTSTSFSSFCSRGIHSSSAAHDSSSKSSSSPPRDYYDVLGVPRGAPEAEVKRAFYRLAKKHHPDANADGDQAEAARKFQEVNKAYDCLRDPQKRALYDQVGVEAFEGGVGSGGAAAGGAGGGGGPGFGGGGFGGFGGGGPFGGGGSRQQQPDVEDIFAAFFGGLGGRAGMGGAAAAGGRGGGGGGFSWSSSSGGPNPFAAAMMRSPDIHVSVRLPFEAAARGGRRTLNLAGIRNESSSRAVEIDVPAGVDTGAVLRLSGQGAPLPAGAPRGAKRGDLLVEVEVEPSPVFARRSREGRPEDVEVRADVDFWDAALGGSATVPTPLDGPRELALRPGTQPGDRLRMKGYGLPRLPRRGASAAGSSSRADRGDQYVRVGVRVPRRLSAKAARLLRELAEEVKGGGGSSGGTGSSESAEEERARAA